MLARWLLSSPRRWCRSPPPPGIPRRCSSRGGRQKAPCRRPPCFFRGGSAVRSIPLAPARGGMVAPTLLTGPDHDGGVWALCYQTTAAPTPPLLLTLSHPSKRCALYLSNYPRTLGHPTLSLRIFCHGRFAAFPTPASPPSLFSVVSSPLGVCLPGPIAALRPPSGHSPHAVCCRLVPPPPSFLPSQVSSAAYSTTGPPGRLLPEGSLLTRGELCTC